MGHPQDPMGCFKVGGDQAARETFGAQTREVGHLGQCAQGGAMTVGNHGKTQGFIGYQPLKPMENQMFTLQNRF